MTTKYGVVRLERRAEDDEAIDWIERVAWTTAVSENELLLAGGRDLGLVFFFFPFFFF